MRSVLFHGTPHADAILATGVDLAARRVSDPGDFGWGFYSVANLARARCHGTVLRVTLDIRSYAHVADPYGMRDAPRSYDRAEDLYREVAFDGDRMRTINAAPAERAAAARWIGAAFLAAGFGGIVTPYAGGEVVTFDVATILRIELHARYARSRRADCGSRS